MIIVVAGIIRHEGKLLIAQRKKNAHQALLWEFPGGKIEEGETPEEALERELFEELNLKTRTGRVVDVVLHRYPEKDVLLLFYESALLEGEASNIDCQAHAWIDPSEIANYDFAPADRIMLDRNPLLFRL